MNSKSVKVNTIKKSASSPAFLKQLSKTKEVVIKLGEDSSSSESETCVEKQLVEQKVIQKETKLSSKRKKQKISHHSFQNTKAIRVSNSEQKTHFEDVDSKNDDESINKICKEVLDDVIHKVTVAKPKPGVKKVSRISNKSSRPSLKLSRLLEKKLVAVEGEWKKQKLLRLKYKIIEERSALSFFFLTNSLKSYRKRTKLDEQELTSVGNLRAQRKALILKEKKRLKKLEEQIAVAKRVITTSEEQLFDLDKSVQDIRERLALRRSNELSLRQEVESIINQPANNLKKIEPVKTNKNTFDDINDLKVETMHIISKQLSSESLEYNNKLYVRL